MYRPDEIIVHERVRDEPVTRDVLERCRGVSLTYVSSTRAKALRWASRVLGHTTCLAERIAAGKKVLVLVPSTDPVDAFDMPDPRMGCPHFEKLVLASNGCPYGCQWCYLQLTYRGLYPYIAVRVRYDKIMEKIRCRVARSSAAVLSNGGELQDSLAPEHITGAARAFIPFFGQLEKGYLFMLTKADNVRPILDLPHNGHTIIAWSLDAPAVSREFEIEAPSFEKRLEAARLAQQAGYPLRLRLDPIVPLPGWRASYADTIHRILSQVRPERITLGTLRFEAEFYKNRHSIVGARYPRSRLLGEMQKMVPMLPPMELPTGRVGPDGKPKVKVSVGKYSYPDNVRINVFGTIIEEIRKWFDGPIALCKETLDVWNAVGLDPHHCRCVCQYDEADLAERPSSGIVRGYFGTHTTPHW